jgi:hypothetical protein
MTAPLPSWRVLAGRFCIETSDVRARIRFFANPRVAKSAPSGAGLWLSAALLRSIARDAPKDRRSGSSIDAALLLLEADECFRCARIPGLKKEIAEGLEATGHESMTKAVEIETALQREKWQK